MIKKMSGILTIILILILIATSVMVGINFAGMRQSSEQDTRFNDENLPDYHFMVIIDGTGASYTEQIREGIEGAAVQFNVTYEFWDISTGDLQEEILKQFDRGVYSQVDGIIVNTYNTEDYKEVVERAHEVGIPVVTLNEDISDVEKTSHMELNQYRIGSRIGSVLNLSEIETGTIVVIHNEAVENEEKARGIYENLFGDFEVEVEIIENQGPNLINAEGLTRQIISDYSDLRAIVCNDSQVTMGVVQALKDTNKVGDVMVIGYGFNDEIKGYIEKAVIYSTVVVDYRDLGYTCIEALVKANQGDFVSAYTSLNVVIPTKENLNEYLLEAGYVSDETSE